MSLNLYERRRRIRRGRSPYHGVYWSKARGCWKAALWYNSREVTIGFYPDEAAAAAAYNLAVQQAGLETELNDVPTPAGLTVDLPTLEPAKKSAPRPAVVMVRMLPALHTQLREQAKQRGLTLNQLCVEKLAQTH